MTLKLLSTLTPSMKTLIASFLTLLIFSQTLLAQSNADEIAAFESELGPIKTELMRELITFFDQALKRSFLNVSNTEDQVSLFLKSGINQLDLDSLSTTQLLSDLESSGFRVDLWITQEEAETYQDKNPEEFFDIEADDSLVDLGEVNDEFEELTAPVKTKSSQVPENSQVPESPRLNINTRGLIFYALAKTKQGDADFMNALKTLWLAGDISPALYQQAYEKMTSAQRHSWENVVILTTLIYYRQLLWKFGYG